MTPPPWLIHVPPVALLVFCLGCLYTDLREFKIYNSWSFGFMALGLALAGALGGGPALLDSLGGMALGFAALFPFFAMGGIAAGDAKMLMAIGALLGWRFLVSTFLWGALAGAVQALVVLLWDARKMGGVTAYLLVMQREIREKVPRQESQRSKLPYGLAIAVGALVAWFRPVLQASGT